MWLEKGRMELVSMTLRSTQHPRKQFPKRKHPQSCFSSFVVPILLLPLGFVLHVVACHRMELVEPVLQDCPARQKCPLTRAAQDPQAFSVCCGTSPCWSISCKLTLLVNGLFVLPGFIYRRVVHKALLSLLSIISSSMHYIWRPASVHTAFLTLEPIITAIIYFINQWKWSPNSPVCM